METDKHTLALKSRTGREERKKDNHTLCRGELLSAIELLFHYAFATGSVRVCFYLSVLTFKTDQIQTFQKGA